MLFCLIIRILENKRIINLSNKIPTKSPKLSRNSSPEHIQQAHILMQFIGHGSATLPLDQSLTKEQLLNVADEFAQLHTYIRVHPEIFNPVDFLPFGSVDQTEENKADFEKMGENILHAMEKQGDGNFLKNLEGLKRLSENACFRYKIFFDLW